MVIFLVKRAARITRGQKIATRIMQGQNRAERSTLGVGVSPSSWVKPL